MGQCYYDKEGRLVFVWRMIPPRRDFGVWYEAGATKIPRRLTDIPPAPTRDKAQAMLDEYAKMMGLSATEDRPHVK